MHDGTKTFSLSRKPLPKGWNPIFIGCRPQQLNFIDITNQAQAAVALILSGTVGSYTISDAKSYARYALANITKRLLQRKTLTFHLPVFLVKGIAESLEWYENEKCL